MDLVDRRTALPGVRYASTLGRTRLHAVQVTNGQGAYTTLCGVWAYDAQGEFDPQDAIACRHCVRRLRYVEARRK